MARPCKFRKLEGVPSPVLYMPAGWTKQQNAPAEVAIEDFEVLRLVDGHALTIEEAAKQLGVSRSTAGRMLERGRRAIALAMERRLPIFIDAAESSVLSRPQVDVLGRSADTGRVAIAVEAPDPGAAVARIFGRAPFFAVFGTGGEIRYIENAGAGVKRKAAALAVEQLATSGVGRVVAGRFGADALQALGDVSINPLLITGMKLSEAIELLPVVEK